VGKGIGRCRDEEGALSELGQNAMSSKMLLEIMGQKRRMLFISLL